MSEITQILLRAMSGDAAALNQLNAAEASNFAAYILALTSEMQTVARPAESRFVAATLVKRTLVFSTRETLPHRDRWIALDAAVKSQVKQVSLMCLADPDSRVAGMAAQIVSQIALVELPRREWSDLIGTLTQGAAAGKPAGLRESALAAIGYVCEEIEPAAIAEHTNSVLSAVVQGMHVDETSEKIRLVATKALLSSLDFVKSNFEAQGERDYLMRIILENTRAKTHDVRERAYECLVRVGTLYYDKLAAYMQAIFNVTVACIKSVGQEEDGAVMQAIEFWSNLADLEDGLNEAMLEAEDEGRSVDPSERCMQYVRGAVQFLCEALLVCLTKMEEEHDEDAWDPPMAAATCLSLIAACVKDAVIPAVMPFITANISSQDWTARQAAILAFGSIVDGPPRVASDVLSGPGALQVLLQHMQDPMEIVRDTTAWTLGRLCKFHIPVVTATQERFQSIVVALATGFNDTSRVAINCCWAIGNLVDSLFESVPSPPPKTSMLSPAYKQLVDRLLEVAEKQDAGAKLKTSAYATLCTVARTAPEDCGRYVQELATVAGQRLTAYISAGTGKESVDVQALLCSVLTECLRRYSNDQVLAGSESLFNLYLALFNKAAGSASQEEALIGMAAIASSTETAFARFLPAFVPLVHQCLRNFGDHDLCKVAAVAAGDVCRVTQSAFAPYARGTLTLLMSALQSKINKSVKPLLLSCVGDLAMAVGNEFLPFLPAVVTVLRQACVLRADEDDEDDVDFIEELREAVFEAFTGIIQGLRAVNQAGALVPHVPAIVDAIRSVFTDTLRHERVLKGMAGTIGDLTHALGAQLKTILAATPVPISLLSEMVVEIRQAVDKNDSVQVAQWAKDLLDHIS